MMTMFISLGPTTAARKRQPGVGDPHDDLVDPPADVAGEDAEQGTHHPGHQHRGEADHDRDPRAEDEPGEHVASQVVAAQEELLAAALLPHRGPEALAEAAHLGVVGRQDVGEEGHEEEEAEERGGDPREPLAAAGDQAPARGQGRGPRAVHRASRMRGSITA
jgi:hypothetical protein